MCHEITPARLDRFTSLIDPAWIQQALHATGTASLRRRLPAEQAIWLVIGLALFRNQPIWHIVRQLALDQGTTPQGPVPSASVSAPTTRRRAAGVAVRTAGPPLDARSTSARGLRPWLTAASSRRGGLGHTGHSEQSASLWQHGQSISPRALASDTGDLSDGYAYAPHPCGQPQRHGTG